MIVLDENFINYLDTLFPDRCPYLDESEREIFYKSGQRSVVEFLKSKIQDEDENVLNQPTIQGDN